MWTAVIRCIGYVFRSGFGWTSALLTGVAALKEIAGYEIIPFPGWAWWLAAIAAFFTLAVKLQFQLDAKEASHIRKLRMQRHVTFGEIADVLPKSFPEYSREEILHRLLRALWRGHFEQMTGHSRLAIPNATGYRIVGREMLPLPERDLDGPDERNVMAAPPRILFDRIMMLEPPMGIDQIYPSLPTQKFYGSRPSAKELRETVEWELLASIRPSQYNTGYLQNYVERLSMERRDFNRWLSRLQRGKYEQ